MDGNSSGVVIMVWHPKPGVRPGLLVGDTSGVILNCFTIPICLLNPPFRRTICSLHRISFLRLTSSAHLPYSFRPELSLCFLLIVYQINNIPHSPNNMLMCKYCLRGVSEKQYIKIITRGNLHIWVLSTPVVCNIFPCNSLL